MEELMEIRKNQLYTLTEAKSFLKVSTSTILRLIRRGEIQSARIGRQYRILGKELLRLASPRNSKLYNNASGKG